MILFAGEGPDSDIVCNGDFPAAPTMGDYKGRYTYGVHIKYDTH